MENSKNTFGDLYNVARNNPLVFTCLKLKEIHNLSEHETLLKLTFCLLEVNKDLQDRLLELYHKWPLPIMDDYSRVSGRE